MQTTTKKKEKVIRVALKDGDFTQTKVNFRGGIFTPEEFTCMVMALIETYTVGLLKKNSNKAVFEHWNNAFGIFLNKIVPPEKHYKLSKEHKDFKEAVDSTLGQPENKEDTEENRLAAYLIARDILVNDVGMTEESADILLNKKLGLIPPGKA